MKPRMKHIAAFLASVIVMLFFTGAITLTIKDSKQDSGVIACQEMADRIEKSEPSKVQVNQSNDAYAKAAKPFEESKYADLRKAGVNFVASVKALDRAVDKDDGSALEPLINSQRHHEDLRDACANHGTYVPRLP